MTLGEFLQARLDDTADMARSGIAAESYLSELGEHLLREVQAKRQMLAWHDQGHPHEQDPCSTQCLMVLPYADHPDFDPAWDITRARA